MYETDSMWTSQIVKEIIGKQKTKSNPHPPSPPPPPLPPQEIKVDKTIRQNPQHIAKEFKKLFYFCWTKIGEKNETLENYFKTF